MPDARPISAFPAEPAGATRAAGSQGGFTLVELVGVIVLLSILGVMAVAKIGNHNKGTKLLGEARVLFAEMGNARSQVIRTDKAYLMRFDLSANMYLVYEDKNGNGAVDAGEEVRRKAFDRKVAYGSPAGGPAKGPGSTGAPTTKVEGAWTKAMVIGNDRAATMNAGSVYLYAPGIPRVICIRMPANSRRLEMWRWDGSKWIAM